MFLKPSRDTAIIQSDPAVHAIAISAGPRPNHHDGDEPGRHRADREMHEPGANQATRRDELRGKPGP